VTQKPSEFFITLTDDLSVPQFAALANSVAELLRSIPTLTQQASSQPGQGENFLAIRSREVDEDNNNEDFWHSHQATYWMGIEHDQEGPRALFRMSLDAETWRMNVERTNMERAEVSGSITIHNLGPYERTERPA
jgi:hypothetical protein